VNVEIFKAQDGETTVITLSRLEEGIGGSEAFPATTTPPLMVGNGAFDYFTFSAGTIDAYTQLVTEPASLHNGYLYLIDCNINAKPTDDWYNCQMDRDQLQQFFSTFQFTN
jgi:hypothetical protein